MQRTHGAEREDTGNLVHKTKGCVNLGRFDLKWIGGAQRRPILRRGRAVRLRRQRMLLSIFSDVFNHLDGDPDGI